MVKTKIIKNKKTNKITSLDALHTDFLDEFNKNNKTIEEAKIILSALNTKLNDHDEKNISKPNYLEKRSIILSKIDKINDYIEGLEHEEIDYYYKTIDILKEYYESDQNNTNISDIYDENENYNDDNISTNDFVLSKINNKDIKLSTNKETNSKKKVVRAKNNILSILNGTDNCLKKVKGCVKTTKNELYNNYREIIIADIKSIDNTICNNCNQKYISYKSKGIRVCSNCNIVEKSKPEIDMTNYTDTRIKKPVMAYRTENHFKVWMTHIQGRETRVPPEEVINDTKKYLKKHNYTEESMKNINNLKIKEVLKNLNYSKYYKNIPFISWKITGIQPPHLTKQEEAELLEMFMIGEEPINRHYKEICDKLNNPSYPCIIYKLLQILEHHALELQKFKDAERYKSIRKTLILLRSSKKLADLDKSWRNICQDVGWSYVNYDN